MRSFPEVKKQEICYYSTGNVCTAFIHPQTFLSYVCIRSFPRLYYAGIVSGVGAAFREYGDLAQSDLPRQTGLYEKPFEVSIDWCTTVRVWPFT